MKTKTQSEPRFRQISTSRIKDGRLLEHNHPIKNMVLSGKKIENKQNPEFHKPNLHDHKEMPATAASDKWAYISTQIDSPIKKIAEFKPPQTARARPNPNKSYGGRIIQFPLPHSKELQYNAQQFTQNNEKEKKRSQSSVNMHDTYVDCSKKSREVKEKYVHNNEKIKVAMKYLLETNEEYLGERSRLCNQKARPKSEIFKINLAATLPTYRNHYPPKEAKFDFEMEPQNEKTAFSLPKNKVCGESISHEFHNGTQGPRADLATWSDGFKLEGPLANTTTYGNKFPHYGQYEKMVPVASFNEHPMGLGFSSVTTHKEHFKGKPQKRSQTASWNNLHPYGNEFNPNRSTQYRSSHGSKEKQPIQQWPNYNPRLIVPKSKFSTEYNSEHKNMTCHEINDENHCKCGHCGRKRKHIY